MAEDIEAISIFRRVDMMQIGLTDDTLRFS
jgi:hypothetical protein